MVTPAEAAVDLGLRPHRLLFRSLVELPAAWVPLGSQGTAPRPVMEVLVAALAALVRF